MSYRMRRVILGVLDGDWRSAKELSHLTDESESNLRLNLRDLERAGVVESIKIGNGVLFRRLSDDSPEYFPARKGVFPTVLLGDGQWDRIVVALRARQTRTDSALAERVEQSVQSIRRRATTPESGSDA